MSVDSEIATKVVQKNFHKLQKVNQDWLFPHLYSVGLIDSVHHTTNLLTTICDGIKEDSSKFTELIEIFSTDSVNSYISDSLQSDYGEYDVLIFTL